MDQMSFAEAEYNQKKRKTRREVFLERQNQPFGMALRGDTFYLGNTDALLAFPYTEGDTKITAAGRHIASFTSQ